MSTTTPGGFSGAQVVEQRYLLPEAAPAPRPLYGLMAEFVTVQELLRATRRARRAGYRTMDAYAPYPVRGLPEALGHRHTQVPFVVLAGGLSGAGAGLIMQYWTMAWNYPFDVGGRPLNSWPVFIPVAFEIMVLVASLSAVLGLLFLNGLPRLHHPVFNVARFVNASQDRFFLCIEAKDPRFDDIETKRFLQSQGAAAVMEVPFSSRVSKTPAQTAELPVDEHAVSPACEPDTARGVIQ